MSSQKVLYNNISELNNIQKKDALCILFFVSYKSILHYFTTEATPMQIPTKVGANPIFHHFYNRRFRDGIMALLPPSFHL